MSSSVPNPLGIRCSSPEFPFIEIPTASPAETLDINEINPRLIDTKDAVSKVAGPIISDLSMEKYTHP